MQQCPTAHKQGRVAGETAVGGDREFAGSLGTQVVKVFELAVARTGLRDQEAAAAGVDSLTVESTQFDHKADYPGAHQLHIRITGDRTSGQLLGAQLVGHHDAEVAKRIDIPANALFHHMTVDGLNDPDLSYTHPSAALGRHPARRPSLDAGEPIPSRWQPYPRSRPMKLRLFPRQEVAYFGLLQAAADTIGAAATVLLDLLIDLADPEAKAKQLAALEHQGDRITRTILTRLASTFIARLDRDDIFELAERLDNVTDAIEDVGSMAFLHGITQPLDAVTEQARVLLRAAEHTSQGMRSLDQLHPDRLSAYLTAIDDLEHEGDQLHRRVLARLYEFTGEHPAQHMLGWKDITDGIEQALNELAHVAHTVEGIVLKHA